MGRLLAPPKPLPRVDLDDVQHLVMDDVSWSFYERFLKEIGSRHIRVTYDEGRMEIMSPLPEHERPSRLIGRLIQTITFVRGLPIASLGSTTFRRKDRARGMEPDECFFLKHAEQVRGMKRWDPKKDPPPDLVIEADITHRSIDRHPIYASLGVPELWRWNGKRLDCLQLFEGNYKVVESSLAFPFLKPADLTPFVLRAYSEEENTLIRGFIAWLETENAKA